MRCIPHAIALAAIVASTQTLAAAPQDHRVTTTGDLVELCSVSADDPLYDAAMGFCLGYMDATLDYHAALTAGQRYDPLTCPDPAVTREEVVVVVLEWSEGNAQLLETEAPVQGAMRAVSEKWPCSGQ
jgi:hypothetical protein